MLARPALIALRAKFESTHGRINDNIFPCAALVEKRLEEIEEGSFTATPLTEVICVDKADDDQIVVDLGSSIKVRKPPKAIALPVTTEELRDRFETLAISFVLASYKHGNRLWVKTATMEAWTKYVKYLLSDEVALFHMDQEGLNIKASWNTVLLYDMAMRKKICRLVLYERMDFLTAMEATMKDAQIKERYFNTPTALLNSSAGSKGGQRVPPPPAPGAPPAADQLSNKKRKAAAKDAAPNKKGAGKGKGAKGGGRQRKTPDGRMICDFYNRAVGCNKTPCTFLHVCNLCFGTHAACSNTCKTAGV